MGIWAGVNGDVDFKHIEVLLSEGPECKGRDGEIPGFCAKLAVIRSWLVEGTLMVWVHG